MVFFQQHGQSLCPAMGFSLWVSSVNFGTSGLYNVEQLVIPDFHFLHLKGVVVFCKSTMPLCSNALIVVSPHVLATVTDSFQLSLSPEAAFSQFTLLELLVGSLYGHLMCVWAWDAVSRGCVHVCVIHILPDDSESNEAWSLVLFELPAAVPSFRSMVALVGLEGGWQVPILIVQAGSSLWYQFGHVFITLNRAVFTPNLSPWGAELGPLVAMINKWTAGRAVPLFWGGVSNAPRKWAPHWGSANKGDIWQERY